MPAFSISRDHLNVLRLRRRAYPMLTIQEQETFEVSASVYGHLVARNESLDAPTFLARIRANYQSSDPRQAEVERVIELCMDHSSHAPGQSTAAWPMPPASAQQSPG